MYENNCVVKSDYFKHFNSQNTKNIKFLNSKSKFKVVSNWTEIQLPKNINKINNFEEKIRSNQLKVEYQYDQFNLVNNEKKETFIKKLNQFLSLTKNIVEI